MDPSSVLFDILFALILLEPLLSILGILKIFIDSPTDAIFKNLSPEDLSKLVAEALKSIRHIVYVYLATKVAEILIKRVGTGVERALDRRWEREGEEG